MWCIVPAAGIGSRFDSGIPKQYAKINPNITILEKTLTVLCEYDKFSGILVILNKNDTLWPSIEISQHEKVHTCIGGKNRSDSVLNGLRYLSNSLEVSSDEWVMVHDAARPGITPDLINKLYNKVISKNCCGGILAYPVSDTAKEVNEKNEINKTIDRSNLWMAQTPQIFKLNQLTKSLTLAKKKEFQVTDESSAIEFSGLSPLVVEGDVTNFKITTKNDLAIMQAILFNQ